VDIVTLADKDSYRPVRRKEENEEVFEGGMVLDDVDVRDHDTPKPVARAMSFSESTNMNDGDISGTHGHGHGEDTPDHDHLAESLKSSKTFLVAIILLVALSFHSVIEGLALGAGETEQWGILIAILAHKSLEAFALGTNLLRSGLTLPRFLLFIIGFCLTTPFGIGIGAAAEAIAAGSSASAVCVALASGTFLFVAVMEIIPKELAETRDKLWKILGLLTGFGLMAVLALWT